MFTLPSRLGRAVAGTALVVPCIVAAPAGAQNLVTDGGFENPVGCAAYNTGPMGAWSVVQASSYIAIYDVGCAPGANATEGKQACDLGFGGTGTGNYISQQLPTVAGETYTLTFDWGSEYDWGTYGRVTVGDLDEVLIDDPAAPPCHTSVCHIPWIQHSASFDFVASGDDVLTFTDETNSGNAPGPNSTSAGLSIDSVVVVLEGTTPTVTTSWGAIKSVYR